MTKLYKGEYLYTVKINSTGEIKKTVAKDLWDVLFALKLDYLNDITYIFKEKVR